MVDFDVIREREKAINPSNDPRRRRRAEYCGELMKRDFSLEKGNPLGYRIHHLGG
jgi:hypothetical protein